MPIFLSLLVIAFGYLLGSLSSAYLLVRVMKGTDLRRIGTGTVGGSNAARQLGRPWLLVVATIDALKGLVPVAVARLLGLDLGVALLAGLAAVVGHNWSFLLRFKGGRGLATIVGALLAVDPRLFFFLLAIVALSFVLRLSAPGSLVGIALLAPAAWLLGDPLPVMLGSIGFLLATIAKRLEANRMPLPAVSGERRAVFWRRFWNDRDVPRDQPWQEREAID